MTCNKKIDPGYDISWGFLGAGNLAQNATAAALHASANGTLAAAAARDISRAQKLEPLTAYDSYERLLEDSSIDAIYISLNNDAHFPWIMKSIEAGKHVLCEKPMTMSASDTTRAFDAAREAHVTVVEATWALWHPRMQRVAQLIREGAIGSVQNYLGTFTFNGVPENNYRLYRAMGGGALYDTGIYPLNALVSFLTPDTAYTVTQASCDFTHPHDENSDADMTTKAHIQWSNSAGEGSAAVIASFAMHPSQRFVMKGKAGEIRISDDQAFTCWKQPSTLEINGASEHFEAVDPYQIMFEQFGAHIHGDPSWLPESWQSVRVAEIVDSVFECFDASLFH